MNLRYVALAKSYIYRVNIDIKDEIVRSVQFVGGKNLVELHFKLIKHLSINMMLTNDTLHCSLNTTRRRMDLSARQKNASNK